MAFWCDQDRNSSHWKCLAAFTALAITCLTTFNSHAEESEEVIERNVLQFISLSETPTWAQKEIVYNANDLSDEDFKVLVQVMSYLSSLIGLPATQYEDAKGRPNSFVLIYFEDPVVSLARKDWRDSLLAIFHESLGKFEGAGSKHNDQKFKELGEELRKGYVFRSTHFNEETFEIIAYYQLSLHFRSKEMRLKLPFYELVRSALLGLLRISKKHRDFLQETKFVSLLNENISAETQRTVEKEGRLPLFDERLLKRLYARYLTP